MAAADSYKLTCTYIVTPDLVAAETRDAAAYINH